MDDGSLGVWGCHASFRRGGPFNHRLPVQIRRPVNQVESAEEDREHDSGHLVDLADAVVSLFVLRGLVFRRVRCARGSTGGPCRGLLLRDVGGMGHLSGGVSIGGLIEYEFPLLFLQNRIRT